jgi:hypothetical protein
MRINCKLLLVAAFLTVTLSANAQSLTTYSPYSRFGIGEIRNRGYANTKAMGDISQGIRTGRSVNFLNPASYTAQDSMSFIFDFGLEGSGVNYQAGENSNFNSTGNLHHIAIQFPITKWMGASAGIQPFSKVGYRLRYTETDDNLLSSIGAIKYYHYGKGGITQSYFGLALQPFKGFSVGANLSYFFGSIEHSTSVIFPEDKPYNNLNRLNTSMVRDMGFSFGAQYAFSFGSEKKYKVVLGATLDNETAIGTQEILFVSYQVGNYRDTIAYTETPDRSINYPQNFTGGFSFAYKNIFLVGVDYNVQDWTNANFTDQSGIYTKSQTIRAGAQVTPNPSDLRSYYKRITYRAGFYQSKTYLQLRDNQINDYGITFGVGLPFRRSNTSMNISWELGRKGTLDNNLVQETYGIFNVGFTFYDFWFVKRKYN